jgi:hypothetical protein
MNQLSLDYSGQHYSPAPNTQQATLLAALQRGERLTVGVALQQYGVYALSQRMGDLRRMNWPVQSQMVTVGSGKRIAEYWMAA